MIAAAGSIKRGIRNVLRNPIRLLLVVLLLGASLTFTAAMLSLNSGSQNEIAKIRQQVGTEIDVSPAFTGGFQVFGTISKSQVLRAEHLAHVVGVSQTVQDQYRGTNLYGVAKIPTRFKQFGFQRAPRGRSNGGGFFPGQGAPRGPTFFRRLLNGGKGGTIPPSVTGVSGAASGITISGSTIKLSSGRDLSSTDNSTNVALMSAGLAKANKLSIGSTFKLNGTKTRLVGEFKVSGSSSTSSRRSTAQNSIVVPLKLAEKIFKLNGITDLTVFADNAGNVSRVASELQSSLGNSVTVTSSVQTYASTFSALDSTSHNIQAALVASVITAALIIVFAIFLIVRERTREIGVLKAIGASSTNIVTQFTAEVLGLSIGAAAVAAVLLAVFGGQIAHLFDVSPAQAAGLPSGGFPGRGFTGGGGFAPGGGFSGTPTFFHLGRNAPTIATTPLNAGLTPGSLLLLLGFAVCLAVLASWVPTWYVSRLRPARVLSNA